MKKFAVFDIDGTLIRWQLYHAIVDALARVQLIDPELHEEIRSARLTWKNRAHEDAYKDYERNLVINYEKVLVKLSQAQFNQAVDAVFNEYKDQVYRYTRQLIKQLKDDGYFLLAISSSQSEIIEKIAAYYGFDDFSGTVYEHQAGKFTGAKQGYFGTKHIILQKFIDHYNLTLTTSVAVGDSEGDITMLEMVAQPIAFNPTKKLFEHAQDKGWKIVVERKNVVYELGKTNDGYRLLA